MDRIDRTRFHLHDVPLGDPNAQVETTVKFLGAGFHSLKLNVGANHVIAVKRFRTVREAVGGNIVVILKWV